MLRTPYSNDTQYFFSLSPLRLPDDRAAGLGRNKRRAGSLLHLPNERTYVYTERANFPYIEEIKKEAEEGRRTMKEQQQQQ